MTHHYDQPNALVPAETDRLMFRNWTTTDLKSFHVLCSDPDVMQWIGLGEPWSLQRTEQFIAQARELSQTIGFCQWPLIYKPNSTLIGFCGFVPTSDGAEIGWRLAKAYWGQGLATEAARAAHRHGIEKLGFSRITATIQSPNLGSLRVIEKLGMKRESTFQRNGREVILFSTDNRIVP